MNIQALVSILGLKMILFLFKYKLNHVIRTCQHHACHAFARYTKIPVGSQRISNSF